MKTKKLLKLSLLSAALSVSLPIGVLAGSNRAPDLFDDFDIDHNQSARKTLPKKAVPGRVRRVNVHSELFEEDSLTLNLFNDIVVTAVRDKIIDNGKDRVWIGSIKDIPDSEVFLTERGRHISGNVQIGDKIYEIDPKGEGRSDITQVDFDKNPHHSHSRLPQGAPPENDGAGITAATAPVTANAAAGTVIDLLVVYTAKAKNNASGQAGIEAKITNAVAMANQAYINSKVDLQLNLVGMKEVNYTETGNMSTSLSDLTGAGDGKMDDVHTWRNQLGADQVSLVSTDANYCGIGYMMTSSWISTAFAAYAFSVVHDDSVYACLSGNTLAHELGHNQGNQHNIEDSGGTAGAYGYSYGYRLCQTGGFRTVMSYSCTGGTRVSYFSNPNVILTTGEATGTANANNALSMNNTKAIVAAFRAGAAASVPNAPTNLTAAAASGSVINLTWADNSSNETGFRVERSGDGINWSEIGITGSNATGFASNGLVAGSAYFFRVRAYNSNGFSAYSNTGNAVTTGSACVTGTPLLTLTSTAAYVKPGAAVGFNAALTNTDSSACGAATFALSGSDGSSAGSFPLGAGASTTTIWSTTAPGTDGAAVKTLTASAAGHASAQASVSVTVDGTAPSAPGNLTASKAGRNGVSLAWSAAADSLSGLSGYTILRNGVVIGTTAATGFTDMQTLRGSTITYTVKATDKVGNSSSSSTLIRM